MDIFIMYSLMLCDLLFTVFNYKDADELNPMFRRLLYGGGAVWFVYLKLLMNTSTAFAIIYIRRYRHKLSFLLSLLGIIIYGLVLILHIEIYQVNHGRNPITEGVRQMLFVTEDAAKGVARDAGIKIIMDNPADADR